VIAIVVASLSGLVAVLTAFFTHKDAAVANKQSYSLEQGRLQQEAVAMAIKVYTDIIETQQDSLEDLRTLLREAKDAADTDLDKLRSKLMEGDRTITSLQRRNEQLLSYIAENGLDVPPPVLGGTVV
jgi:DUF438 domain-containing protein